ncbi:beta-ketoacyl-ACP synthase 3 [Anabaena sp. FACHB-709]|uniref:Beta-ketoacyl-[acyl-carrier-protein] synthase III n=3 Tax=Nostocaceae TaxID=1162 RepID=FABH_NOSS1|nr:MULTISPECIES: beta-ketoacyl-ACP synthase 3 [Nostocaceae]Q8Z062.1 RecName: Full=Beta-ketoacyl-[acyl-carrier-protein] synthase III; Short=Beta-ketoacyl-ACP synthase III; Short=KAS III; AltName: Full=3-oxoacyl-[acyl-carrier-protein] synthase 3; AltName: Full=3-oxoacyl-[acyl-carrier-protein] synthase III [Nostoc sp. PCC 7120 = FACHB-418]BAY71210.1 beta-ketoacyl-acyl carrier protein synthase III [Trichormus variabilis NIES-23]HBW32767.1 beta-ketoacyl-ACP synthase 3 [Nostoc sp. UBA8866]MBD2172006.
MQNLGIAITGSGSAVPETSLHNEELSQLVETSDEWISTRTGIRQRRLALPTESLSSLAAAASRQAIASAGITASDIDLILLATSTPDDLFGTATKIQAELGANKAVAFDLTAACSGFVFGLVTAAQFIRTGVYQNVLLIGADILSRWVDWQDRRTCVLFGDGAGAVVLQANSSDRLLGFALKSDGTQNHYLNLAYQGTAKEILPNVKITQGTYQPVTMNGKEVYRFAAQKVPEIIDKALFEAQLTVDQIDWLLLHQANQRILDTVAQRLNIPAHKVISNLANYGNTSAASIPLALDEAVREGKIKPNDIIATSGFGAGLTWGAAIFQWGR